MSLVLEMSFPKLDLPEFSYKQLAQSYVNNLVKVNPENPGSDIHSTSTKLYKYTKTKRWSYTQELELRNTSSMMRQDAIFQCH